MKYAICTTLFKWQAHRLYAAHGGAESQPVTWARLRNQPRVKQPAASGSEAMINRPHRTHLTPLILAIVAVTLNVLPRIETRFVPALLQSRGELRGGNTGTPLLGADELRRRLPLTFETNRGQADPDVRFVGRADNLVLLLKTNEAVLSLRKPQQASLVSVSPSATQRRAQSSRSHRLSMKLEGANPTPLVAGGEALGVRANYFIGNDPTKWIRGVETYARVHYSGVYDGVDLVFYGNERQLEYDFMVGPGANPQEIRMRFDGADNIELSSEGALVLHTAAGEVKHERPIAYQENNGSRTEVTASFKRLDDATIGFEVGRYDPSQPLVIDPILVYSSYVGGSADDSCRGIVADTDGNVFLTGDSFSSDFISQASPTNSDVFIGKLSSDGLLLNYSFFGGSQNDFATGLAFDPSGNIYLCGHTESADFPVFNSIGLALKGASDAFAVKLTPDADQFFYSSLVGGSGEESGVSIAADIGGNAYITGRTSSTDYPTFAAIQPVFGGGNSDAFISKLAPDGKSLVYSTFLGGTSVENGGGKSGIRLDASGNAYVTGDTQSTDFPTSNALRTTKDGAASSSDGFVAKIDPNGINFVYATYLGGSQDDFGFAVAADQTGNAYVTGRTRSASFTGSTATRPTTATSDAFVAKLNPAGSAISYLTFLGGIAGDESGNAIVIDSTGNAVIAGTAGEGAPTVSAIQSYFRGNGDAFVAKLGPTGSVSFSSYLGGSNEDVALAVSLDATGAIYLAGFTSSTDFLTVSPLVRENRGARDIFIAKIDPNSNPDGPVLFQAVISGKHLILLGQGFDEGAKLRVNDEEVKTRNEPPDPSQILFAKKAAKRIKSGRTVQLQVRNANGQRSNFLFFTKPE